ncbi:pyridoxal phosphate-dependent aminotransferase, partial [Aliarcobacter butzleri]
GAFYVFINIKKISNDSMKFCADLLVQKGVALVPGLAFGMVGYARFSFATSLEVIKEGVKRIKEFTQK